MQNKEISAPFEALISWICIFWNEPGAANRTVPACPRRYDSSSRPSASIFSMSASAEAASSPFAKM